MEQETPPPRGGGFLVLGHVSSDPERPGQTHLHDERFVFEASGTPRDPRLFDRLLLFLSQTAMDWWWILHEGSRSIPPFDAIGHGVALMCLSRESRLGRFRTLRHGDTPAGSEAVLIRPASGRRVDPRRSRPAA